MSRPIANFILTQAFTAIFAVKTDIIGDRATIDICRETALPSPLYSQGHGTAVSLPKT
ncbi:MAG: hypothetical protein ABI262_13570 [Microcoleus sp.]